MSSPVLNCQNLAKSFSQESGDLLEIFNNVSFQLNQRETISIVGSSGSGKTSLLRILAGLDQPTQGNVSICGEDLAKLNPAQLCNMRNKKLGFIYQFHHLLAEFTALENTLMPLVIANGLNPEATDHAKYLLDRLGLSTRLQHYPSQLSGGERQRVAIARAIVNKPKIIFADEPTGNLDNTTAHNVLDIFLELQQELGTSLIIVSHDLEIAARTQKTFTLHHGNLQSNNQLQFNF